MENKKNNFLIWSARLLSILLLLMVMVVGVLAFGYAQDSAKIRVSHSEDSQFKIQPDGGEAAILSVFDGSQSTEPADTIMIEPGQNILSFISEAKKSDTWFWMVAAKVNMFLPDETAVKANIRTSVDGQVWSEWYDLDLVKNENENEVYMTEVPILLDKRARFAQYSLVLTTDSIGISPQVKDVRLTFLDPDDKLAFVKKSWKWAVDKATGKENIDVITRAEWGADESLMKWGEAEYAPIQQIIVHHTAGSNNSPLDPAAVVRGIYYFHAVEKDWGDIGYNYLVDQYGNIYEGRKGGLGVVAAHATSNNYGSVGVALIGDYTKEDPGANAIKGLIELTEYVGYQADLDLTAKHNFQGKNISVVAGHRDVNSTECPGEKLYEMLPDIAKAAASGQSDLPAKTYEAKFISQSDVKLAVKTAETKSVVVQYQNTGTAVWLKEREEVSLVPVDPYPRSSGFAADEWKSSEEVGFVGKLTVNPGEKVYINLDLKGNENSGVTTEKFALKGPDGILAGSEFSVQVENQFQLVDQTENDSSEQNNSNDQNNNNLPADSSDNQISTDVLSYHAGWVGQSDNIELFPGEKKEVWIQIKNTGSAAWKKSGSNPVRLGTANALDRGSDFYDQDSWLSANRIAMSQSEVGAGEIAKFKFYLQGKLVPGVYDEYFRPVVENVTWMEDQGVFIRVVVKQPEYIGELVGQSEKSVPMLAGQRARFWVEVKNTGNVIWRKDGNSPVVLGTDQEIDRASDFYTPGFWLAPNRAASMKQEAVVPGDTARFEILITAPTETGTYREYFRPVVENMSWMNEMDIYWDIEVD